MCAVSLTKKNQLALFLSSPAGQIFLPWMMCADMPLPEAVVPKKSCYGIMTYFLVFIFSFNFVCQVLLNLANQYANNEMYPEALNSYQVIVKNKMFSNAGEQTIESPVSSRYFQTIPANLGSSHCAGMTENSVKITYWSQRLWCEPCSLGDGSNIMLLIKLRCSSGICSHLACLTAFRANWNVNCSLAFSSLEISCLIYD